MTNSNTSEALTTLDFTKRFPFKYWISDWAKDDTYPEGFRYKLLSVRDESEHMIEFVVVLQQLNGDKKLMKQMSISTDAFERTANVFLEGLTGAYGLQFECLDFSTVRDAAKFGDLVCQAGWSMIDT